MIRGGHVQLTILGAMQVINTVSSGISVIVLSGAKVAATSDMTLIIIKTETRLGGLLGICRL